MEEKLHWDVYSLRLLCVLFDVCRAVPGNFCQAGRDYSGDYSLLHNAEYSKDFLVGCIGIERLCKGMVKKYRGGGGPEHLEMWLVPNT